MRNLHFKQQYLERFDYHIQTTFSPERVIHEIEDISGLYDPVIPEHIQRWSYPQSIEFRCEVINQMKSFAINRPAVIRSQLDNLLLNNDVAKQEDVKIFYANNQIVVECSDQNRGIYRFFDISGRCLQTGTIQGGDRNIFASPVSSGVLIVQVIIDKDIYTKKVIIH
jgi:hypothetical protein